MVVREDGRALCRQLVGFLDGFELFLAVGCRVFRFDGTEVGRRRDDPMDGFAVFLSEGFTVFLFEGIKGNIREARRRNMHN